MRHLGCSLALAALMLSGCAATSGGSPFVPGVGPDAGEQLVFRDRLATASEGRMRRIGEELREALRNGGGATATLRYGLWLATPGHPGHDVASARRRLEGLRAESRGLSAATLALIRIELRILDARAELHAANTRLEQENAQLREKIRALTELERQMGSGDQ